MSKRIRKMPSWMKTESDKIDSSTIKTESNLQENAAAIDPTRVPRVVEYIMSPKELSEAASQYLKELENVPNLPSE